MIAAKFPRFALTLLCLTLIQAGSPPAGAQPQGEAGGSGSSMNLQQAREYMLELINRDRAKFGANPVALDEVASRAAQLHADTMVATNTNSHWHPDGTKPPQRYTECGGDDYVMENSHGLGLEAPWTVSGAAEQVFTREQIESEEKGFFDEQPPNDGHRLNILDPVHTHVGLGLVLVNTRHSDGDSSDPLVSCSQEFINKYGSIRANARRFTREQPFILAGHLSPGVTLYSVDISREELPQPIKLKELRDAGKFCSSYGLPQDKVTNIFPQAYAKNEFGRIVLQGDSFTCQIVPGKQWKTGLYYLIVWARNGEKSKPFVASMRTVPLPAD